MEEVVHLLFDGLAGGELIEREEVLLEVEVEVGLDVRESDRVLEDLALVVLHVRFALQLDVVVEVLDDVGDLQVYDRLHVGLDLGLEVVETVQEGPDVAL